VELVAFLGVHWRRDFLTGTRKKGAEKETTRSKDDPFADKYYFNDEDWVIADRVCEVAGKLKVPPAQVALAWLLQKPGIVAPIIGCTKQQHLDDALGALQVKLNEEQVKFLEEKYVPHKLLGHGAGWLAAAATLTLKPPTTTTTTATTTTTTTTDKKS